MGIMLLNDWNFNKRNFSLTKKQTSFRKTDIKFFKSTKDFILQTLEKTIFVYTEQTILMNERIIERNGSFTNKMK